MKEEEREGERVKEIQLEECFFIICVKGKQTHTKRKEKKIKRLKKGRETDKQRQTKTTIQENADDTLS